MLRFVPIKCSFEPSMCLHLERICMEMPQLLHEQSAASYLAGTGDNRRWQSVGEQIWPRSLSQKINQLFWTSRVATCVYTHRQRKDWSGWSQVTVSFTHPHTFQFSAAVRFRIKLSLNNGYLSKQKSETRRTASIFLPSIIQFNSIKKNLNYPHTGGNFVVVTAGS